MLEKQLEMTELVCQEDLEKQTEEKLLHSQGSLLYPCLSLESEIQHRAMQLRHMMEPVLESLEPEIQITPIVDSYGSSVVTISLDTHELFLGFPNSF